MTPTASKTVAWMRRHITYSGMDDRKPGERIISEAKVLADDIPLYEHPAPAAPRPTAATPSAPSDSHWRQAVDEVINELEKGCELALGRAIEIGDEIKSRAAELAVRETTKAPVSSWPT